VDHDPTRVNDDAYVNQVFEEVQLRVREGVARLTEGRRFPIFC
jgi:hypothetical protein